MNRRWLQVDDPVSRWSIAGVAAVVFLFGVLWRSPTLLGGGAVVLCLVLRRVSNPEEERAGSTSNGRRTSRSKQRAGENGHAHHDGNLSSSAAQLLHPPDSTRSPKSTESLVDDLLSSGRYALLLRPETKEHLTQLDVVRAVRQLDEAMALVPAGRVLLGQLAEQSNSACGSADVDPKLISRNWSMCNPSISTALS